MSSQRCNDPVRRAPRGFTLLEMIAVCAAIGIAAAVGVGTVQGSINTGQLNAEVGTMMSDLRGVAGEYGARGLWTYAESNNVNQLRIRALASTNDPANPTWNPCQLFVTGNAAARVDDSQTKTYEFSTIKVIVNGASTGFYCQSPEGVSMLPDGTLAYVQIQLFDDGTGEQREVTRTPYGITTNDAGIKERPAGIASVGPSGRPPANETNTTRPSNNCGPLPNRPEYSCTGTGAAAAATAAAADATADAAAAGGGGAVAF